MKKKNTSYLKLRKSKVYKLNDEFPFKIRGGLFMNSCWCWGGTTSIGTQQPPPMPQEPLPIPDLTRGCHSWNVAC